MINCISQWLSLICIICKLQVKCSDDVIEVIGAGTSVVYAAYQQWGLLYGDYRRKYQSVRVTYRNIGTQGGYCRIKKECEGGLTPVFTSTLLDFTAEDHRKYPQLVSFPAYALAAVIMYNLPGINNLNLTEQNIVDIFAGNLTWWNDTRLQELNVGIDKLPDKPISVVIRTDNCGSNQILSTALSSISPEWNRSFGIFSTGDGFQAKKYIRFNVLRSVGMIGIISSIEYTIGYGPLGDATSNRVSIASLTNKRSTLISTDKIEQGVYSAMNYYSSRGDIKSLVDADTTDAYPLAIYGNVMVNSSTSPGISCQQMMEFVRFIEWGMRENRTKSIEIQYDLIYITPNLVDHVRKTVLQNLTCNNDDSQTVNVYQMMIDQIEQEKIESDPVYQVKIIAIPTILCVVLIIIFIGLLQYYRGQKIIYAKRWLIPTNQIQPFEKAQQNRRKSQTTTASTVRRLSVITSLELNSGFINDPETMIGIYDRKKYLLIKDRTEILPSTYSKKTQQMLHTLHRDNKNAGGDSNHLLQFLGVTVTNSIVYFVFNHPGKGCLHDVLVGSNYDLSNDVKEALMKDCLAGMEYLHRHDIVHGCLNSLTCYLDSNWSVKIGQWTQTCVSQSEASKIYTIFDVRNAKEKTEFGELEYLKLFYVDPTVLQKLGTTFEKTNDIYSFGVLMIETYQQAIPYFDDLISMSFLEVMISIIEKQRHPAYQLDAIPKFVQNIIETCFLSIGKRTNFKEIRNLFNTYFTTKKGVVECMMRTMEHYTATLEERVEERASELKSIESRMEHLLLAMLPEEVALKLIQGEPIEPEYFQQVTIYFSDIVGFHEISTNSNPQQIVSMLNAVYSLFDGIIETFDVYKVETIGDSYMVASGLPKRNGDQHVIEIAKMAICLLQNAKSFSIPHQPDDRLQIRIGINTGPCMTGVVGLKMPRYCLFGDTVNTASRMESNSLPLKIHASESSAIPLKNCSEFIVSYRGTMPIKGKGDMNTYWISSSTSNNSIVSSAEQCRKLSNQKESIVAIRKRISSTIHDKKDDNEK